MRCSFCRDVATGPCLVLKPTMSFHATAPTAILSIIDDFATSMAMYDLAVADCRVHVFNIMIRVEVNEGPMGDLEIEERALQYFMSWVEVRTMGWDQPSIDALVVFGECELLDFILTPLHLLQ